MIIRLLVFTLTAGFLLTSPTARADEYVRCLQNQLTELGYDPGPVDGLWGKRTKAAAIDLRETEPRLQNIDMLDNPRRISAISWCREVGIQFSKARQYRPVDELPPDMLFDDDMTLFEKSRIRSNARRARNELRTFYRIDPAGLTTVIAGSDIRQLSDNLRKAMRKRGGPTNGMTSFVKEHCKSADPYAAFALYGIIVICTDAALPHEEAWKNISKSLNRIMIHEFVHIYQLEYSLASTHPHRFRKNVNLVGPAWLIEGAAMMVELDLSRFDLDDTGFGGILKLLSGVYGTDLKLKNIKEVRSDEEYLISRYATFLLVKRFGLETVLDYWKIIGAGQSPREAFQTQFGMSITEFETLFEELRNSYVASVRYIKETS
ncbi:hypothetical protein NBRC116590_20110 [Pelagimonas sp. KU-00592-HH]|uniref:peptidoglycan-binding domain-containing protein n=1 Tax=Pelagimonas sp. KU-00592-HH TaxID=3127651 RepID=UPI003106D583